MNKSGVDIVFETIRSYPQLLQFGGILIRGLGKYMNRNLESYIGGSQRCQFELFNTSNALPQITVSLAIEDFDIYKGKRNRVSKDEESKTKFRYYRVLCKEDWEKPRLQIYEKCIVDVY